MRFRDRLTISSRLKFIAWWLAGGKTKITLHLKNGIRIAMRSLATTDYGVAYDVFHKRCYDSPRVLAIEPRVIVDLGANVGYTVLHWLQTWPAARVLAFEPHPTHVHAIRENLTLNGLLSSVDLRPCAAGTYDGTVTLSDCGSSSSIVGEQNGITVPMADVYGELPRPVDIIKIDIEGSEYALLDDDRFATVNARAIVIEWHGIGGFERIRQRLIQLGYSVIKTEDGPKDTGLLWAYREPVEP